MAVEYASDVEHQSTETHTSQETAARYLRTELRWMNLERRDVVCVANAGIHDQKLCGGLGSEDACRDVYEANVRTYLALLLDAACGHLVWISITSVGDQPKWPQRNARSATWNGVVRELLAADHPDDASFVDVWNATLLDAIRNGNIHFEPEYYAGLGRLFSSLM